MKAIAIFAVLALILLFGSKSSTEPKLVLLAQLSLEDFVNYKAQTQVSNCNVEDPPVIDSIQIEILHGNFAVREMTLTDEFSSAETVLLGKNQNESVYQLEKPSCVSSITLLGHRVGDTQTKRSVVKLWAYRQ